MKINAPSEYHTLSWANRIMKGCKNYLIRRGWEIESIPFNEDITTSIDIVAKYNDEKDGLIYGFFFVTASYDAEEFEVSNITRKDVESFMLQYCIDHKLDADSSLSMNSISCNVIGEDRAVLRVQYNCFD